MSWLLLTIACGSLGGYLLYRLRVPGGMMIGAFFGVAVLQVSLQQAQFPPVGRQLAQIIAGAFVGATLSLEDLKRLHRLWRGYLILILGLFILNVVIAALIHRYSALDLQTAFFGCIPGGVSTIPLLSADYGADPGVVTLLQFMRMMMGIGVFPTLVAYLGQRLEAGVSLRRSGEGRVHEESSLPARNSVFSTRLIPMWMSLPLACLGAWGLQVILPSLSWMVGALLTVMLLNILFGLQPLPIWIRRIAQIMAGCYIGTTFGRAQLQGVLDLGGPIAILLAGYFVGCLLLGFVFYKVQKMPLTDSFLSAIPAGASDMALISADLGIHDPDIIVVQILRMTAVTTFFPMFSAFIF